MVSYKRRDGFAIEGLDSRLVARYRRLVESHVNAVQAIASGIHDLPRAGSAFATTQAAWRFFSNPRITLPQLAQPAACQAAARSDSPFVLVACDWSKLDFDGHRSKTDLTQLSQARDRGDEMATALLIDAHNGQPLGPLGLTLLSADGLHSIDTPHLLPRTPHLDQVSGWMAASRDWKVDKTCVFVIDREADAVRYFRNWSAEGQRFLVRGDDRRATFRGVPGKLSTARDALRAEQAFRYVGDVPIRGASGQQWVAEAEVVLDAPAWTRVHGKTHRVPGPLLPVRLVMTEVRSASGTILAEWLLLTNVPEVPAETVATWYYWRWRIESFHKLLKSSGLEVEEWQQETASAISRRLLVGIMACVTVWGLEQDPSPASLECQRFLVRLSGRQTKRTRPVTTPALLVGLHQLLAMLEVLEQYTHEQLRDYARYAAPKLMKPSG